ncbi:LLM class flavin-dependent oxidoreductase [Micromonospora sp. NBC_01412]
MRLGLSLGMLHDRTSLDDLLALAQAADQLGYDALWIAEAYSSDVPKLLGWLAPQTELIDLGAAVMQIPARAPTMTAMTAATLDLASGGRFRLGLGISGPVVSEGWYGVPFGQPLTRTREYVAVVRAALTRRPVRFAGRHTTLPLPGAPGEPQRLTMRPLRSDLPIYLAALGPKNLELAGEIADGSLSLFLPPEGRVIALSRVRSLVGPGRWLVAVAGGLWPGRSCGRGGRCGGAAPMELSRPRHHRRSGHRRRATHRRRVTHRPVGSSLAVAEHGEDG